MKRNRKIVYLDKENEKEKITIRERAPKSQGSFLGFLGEGGVSFRTLQVGAAPPPLFKYENN